MSKPVPEFERPARPNRLRSAAVAAVALAAIAGASYSILKRSGIDPIPRPAEEPEQAAAGASTSSRSLLRTVSTGGGGLSAVLSSAEGWDPLDVVVVRSLTARELTRQALLIALRDELGMTTRDETIGEPGGDPLAAEPCEVELRSRFNRIGQHIVSLHRDGEVLFSEQFDAPTAWTVDGSAVAGVMARLSREGFPEALRKAGLIGEPIARVADAPVPEAVADRLDRLSMFDQFAAVRGLHGSIRAEGSSADRIGALVRGYANLGLLTEDLWVPAHKAYKARALLYADRLVLDDPESARPLWHRAYARAMAGLHRDALADLEAAAGKPDSGDRPGWVGLVDAFLRFDTPGLEAVEPDDRLAPLARLLAFRTLESATTRSWTAGIRAPGEDLLLEAAAEALEEAPECGRIHRGSCRFGGVSHLHEATLASPAAHSKTIRARLGGLPGLPEEATELIDDSADEPELMRTLLDAGLPGRDRGELSWSALGHLMQEARFSQAFDRLWFVRNRWSVPADREAAAWRPLVADHPYLPLIDAVVLGLGHPGTLELLRTVPLRDLELTSSRLVMAVRAVDNVWGNDLHREAFQRNDWDAWDQTQMLQEVAPEGLADTANDLLVISPHSPLATAVLIDSGFGPVVDRLDELETTLGHHPAVLEAIGRRYASQGLLADADRVLSKCLERSGDRLTYETLAKIHLARGDLDAWKATLDRFLEQEEDHGLDHASVRVEIARVFMSQGNYELALPYAELAAQTWAGWAMICAIQCYEGLGDMERAELWVRRLSERYPANWSDWFLWCTRTGLGDLDDARALADRFADAQPDRFVSGHYHALAGRPETALEHLRAAFEADPSPMNAGGLILMADEVGDLELRDETLRLLCDGEALAASGTAQIVRPLRDALLADPPRPIDAAEIDETLDAVLAEIPGGRGSYEYLIGQLLRRHGRPLEGLAYLRRCVESDSTYPWWRVAAARALREAGAEDPAVASTGPDREGRMPF